MPTKANFYVLRNWFSTDGIKLYPMAFVGIYSNGQNNRRKELLPAPTLNWLGISLLISQGTDWSSSHLWTL